MWETHVVYWQRAQGGMKRDCVIRVKVLGYDWSIQVGPGVCHMEKFCPQSKMSMVFPKEGPVAAKWIRALTVQILSVKLDNMECSTTFGTAANHRSLWTGRSSRSCISPPNQSILVGVSLIALAAEWIYPPPAAKPQFPFRVRCCKCGYEAERG